MEFESPSTDDRSPEISDEARHMANSRVNLVAPLHADVSANDLSDEVATNQHILQGPIANATNDVEATVALAGATVSPDKSVSTVIVIVSIVAALILCSVAMFVFIK